MILAIKVIRVLLFVIVILLFASSMPVFAGITLLFILGLSKLLKKISNYANGYDSSTTTRQQPVKIGCCFIDGQITSVVPNCSLGVSEQEGLDVRG
ncbi:hypothetical protein [Paenibacillus harenae]|uniref:Uncharacterized protein n=1 Tax=Paenibacillus harenae TaxID=306543 RepID=A0ABT9TX93_PAEHA|nr:hypothetical protein [Paenibacillus harenae]MDQ0111990.1 hypothetical protein [Paenibacillus harenae]